jgi:hypothetical protein
MQRPTKTALDWGKYRSAKKEGESQAKTCSQFYTSRKAPIYAQGKQVAWAP